MTDTRIGGDRVEFPSTEWGLVRLAARETVAMDSVIRIYWKPLYIFVRKRGHDNETAKDIVQDFLTLLLERRVVAVADPERGKFRTLLLSALENFIRDRARTAGRRKRGGERRILSLDFGEGGREYARVAAAPESPERAADRAWARGLLEECLAGLRGNPAHVQALRFHLLGASYSEISARTGLSEAAARTAVHRLQAPFRAILRRQILSTATDPGELELELREFVELLA